MFILLRKLALKTGACLYLVRLDNQVIIGSTAPVIIDKISPLSSQENWQ